VAAVSQGSGQLSKKRKKHHLRKKGGGADLLLFFQKGHSSNLLPFRKKMLQKGGGKKDRSATEGQNTNLYRKQLFFKWKRGNGVTYAREGFFPLAYEGLGGERRGKACPPTSSLVEFFENVFRRGGGTNQWSKIFPSL